MYSGVSIRDASIRFLNEFPRGAQAIEIVDDRTFGILLVKIAHGLDERLRGLGWNTTVTGYDSKSLAGMSIGCLRSLGPALQHAQGDSVVHQQAFFTLLVALTGLLEEAERRKTMAEARPVRIHRFLSSPAEMSDPNAPLEIGEEIGRY